MLKSSASDRRSQARYNASEGQGSTERGMKPNPCSTEPLAFDGTVVNATGWMMTRSRTEEKLTWMCIYHKGQHEVQYIQAISTLDGEDR